jgi:hypothetical protein
MRGDIKQKGSSAFLLKSLSTFLVIVTVYGCGDGVG